MSPTFQVVCSAVVRAELKSLLKDAIQEDPIFGRRALEATRTITVRLEKAAREFGEPTHTLQHLDLEVRQAIILPMAVTFAVHRSQDLVFVMKFQVLSPPSVD